MHVGSNDGVVHDIRAESWVSHIVRVVAVSVNNRCFQLIEHHVVLLIRHFLHYVGHVNYTGVHVVDWMPVHHIYTVQSEQAAVHILLLHVILVPHHVTRV